MRPAVLFSFLFFFHACSFSIFLAHFSLFICSLFHFFFFFFILRVFCYFLSFLFVFPIYFISSPRCYTIQGVSSEEDEMAALESKLEAADLPNEASKAVMRDLARLKRMQASQPEYTVRLLAFLSFLCSCLFLYRLFFFLVFFLVFVVLLVLLLVFLFLFLWSSISVLFPRFFYEVVYC